MRDRVVAQCPKVADKIAVIHNWANPDRIAPLTKTDNWFAQQHGLAAKFTVLYSGNMGRCHDMETILAAAIQLQHEPIQFVFIGDGAKRQDFVDQVNALELSNCSFLPYQPQPVLPYSLTACDVTLVSISPGMEGLVAPSKFYSSLATGRPVAVVCEPHSYLRQIVAEAGCGRAFEHGESESLAQFIRLLLTQPHIGREMGDAGRHYLQANFTPELIAQQYFQVIRRGIQVPQKRSLKRIIRQYIPKTDNA
jgi:glycosyltransferase involved in cell wall biosynthesis